MNETMHAVIQDELGGPDVLHGAEIDRPAPGIGEILIRVHAAGVNPVDMMNRASGIFGGHLPFVLGWDVAGVIAAVGPGVTLFEPGDEVFGMLPFPRGAGAYAEYVVAPTRSMVRKPESLTFVEAAALPLAGLTAWQCLIDTARIGEGARVLITGATGGVGHLAVQIAKAVGAVVIAVGSGSDEALARSLGADEFIDYRTQDFTTEVRDADVVLDVIGGENPLAALGVLRPSGILVSTLPQSLTDARREAAGTGVRVAGLFVEADQLGLLGLIDLVERGLLRPRIAATYQLDEAATAHSQKSGAGKVVLTVD